MKNRKLLIQCLYPGMHPGTAVDEELVVNSDRDVAVPGWLKGVVVEIKIPSGVRSIPDFAFANCRLLRSVSIPDGVGEIGAAAFSNCRLLQSVSLPASCSRIGEAAFQGCSSLRTAVVPAPAPAIGPRAFSNCGSLDELDLDGVSREEALLLPAPSWGLPPSAWVMADDHALRLSAWS